MNGNLCLASIDSLYGNTVLMPKQFNRPFVFGEVFGAANMSKIRTIFYHAILSIFFY